MKHVLRSSASPISRNFTRLIGTAMLAAAACVAAPAAVADTVLDFEDLAPTMLGYQQSFEHKGYRLTATLPGEDNLPGDLVGGIFPGDAASCLGMRCPLGVQSEAYYAGLNDGALVIESLGGTGVQVHAFNASFIGAHDDLDYPAVAGLLEVRGYLADGSTMSRQYDLPGLFGNDFFMRPFETDSAFAATTFTQVAIFAYSCGFNGICEAFSTGQGQFGIDNIVTEISAVPEPATWLMLLAGLGAVTTLARRRA